MSGHPSHTHQGARGLIIVSVTNKVEMNTPVDATIKGAAGVYQIRNLNNGKIYIGSSTNVRKRLRIHRSMLIHGHHQNAHLLNAWKKYGPDAFEFTVLLTCHPSMCTWYEQQFLDQWKPEYNLAPWAEHSGGSHSEETKLKMSRTRLGKPVPALRGRKLTSKHRAMVVRTLEPDNRRGIKLSAEHRAKISKSLIGNKYALGKRYTWTRGTDGKRKYTAVQTKS